MRRLAAAGVSRVTTVGPRPPAEDSAFDPDDRRDGDGRYNLAERIYGSHEAASNSNERTDGDGHAEASNGGYNLASAIYGPSSPDAQRANGGGRNGGATERRYNLAERIYGETAPLTGNALTERAPGESEITIEHRPASLDAQPRTQPAPIGEPPKRGGSFALRTFDSVREVPAFRWYMLASIGSFGAMNMQMIVRGFLAFQLTGSFAVLGTVMLANAIPGLFLTMFGGVVADRYPKRLVVQVGQTLSAVLALAVGLLLLFGMLRMEHLIISAFVNGTIFALMMPARQSWLPEVVGIPRLMNAVALNSAMMTSTRLVGPLLGSLIFAVFGGEWVYFLMVGLYAFSVIMLTRVRSLPVEERGMGMGAGARPGMGRGPGGGRRGGGGWRELTVGFVYIWHNPVIRMLLFVNLATVLLSMPYMTLLPGWVVEVLDGDIKDIGLLQSIGAIGALGGAFLVASLPSRNRGLIYLLGSLLMGVMLIGYSLSSVFWITAGVMIVLNIGSTIRQSLSQILVQSYVEDEYRGRVMAVYMMQMSVMSFGGFAVSIAAEFFGPQIAMFGIAIGLVVLSVSLLLFSPGMRRLQ